MTDAYAGIGSRKTPDDVLQLMGQVAYALAKRGLILRSGAANGADFGFEIGCKQANGLKEIYLPWDGFNQRFEDEANGIIVANQTLGKNIASRYHKGWSHLKEPARLLMGRNTFQVLGADTRSPARFVLCWTPDGSLDGHARTSGGTGQALRIAKNYRIPVYNFARDDHRRLAENWINV